MYHILGSVVDIDISIALFRTSSLSATTKFWTMRYLIACEFHYHQLAETPQSILILFYSFSLMSGYSRIPVHEPGHPKAFLGLLLIKKVCITPDYRHIAIGLRLNLFSSFLSTIPRKNGLFRNSLFPFFPKPTLLSTVSKPSITCELLFSLII